MRLKALFRNGAIGVATAAVAIGIVAGPVATAIAAPTTSQPSENVELSIGKGQMVRLSSPMSDLFVADDKVADVQVRSAGQLYIFGKAAGETTIYATNKAGAVVYSANIRVGTNYDRIGDMLGMAMPDAAIRTQSMNGLILLTGTVASPADVEEAQRLVQAFVGDKTQVISRLKTATPMQVNLQVKIAEVSRTLVKEIGVNLLSRDTTGGFLFGIASGRSIGTIGDADLSALPKLDASSAFGLPSGSLQLPFDPTSGQFVTKAGTLFDLKNLGLGAGKTSLSAAGRLFGLDVASALDLAENDGLVTTLAEPNLTALSGETASFLAGGEIPIPIAQQLGTLSVEYKQYGVSLAFTPTVLSNGRISMRVRPEVSELASNGSVTLNGFQIPAFKTRRAETTVELGSGQSFMIGGLLSNNHNNAIDKAPGLGDLPIIGALFRSNRFARSETELVIMVTPYLVKPVSASQIALPTDGYRAPTDAQRVIMGQTFDGKTGGKRAMPTLAPPTTAPGAPPIAGPAASAAPGGARPPRGGAPAPAPGFSTN
jgi:pilus assembly protein CpaC